MAKMLQKNSSQAQGLWAVSLVIIFDSLNNFPNIYNIKNEHMN